MHCRAKYHRMSLALPTFNPGDFCLGHSLTTVTPDWTGPRFGTNFILFYPLKIDIETVRLLDRPTSHLLSRPGLQKDSVWSGLTIDHTEPIPFPWGAPL